MVNTQKIHDELVQGDLPKLKQSAPNNISNEISSKKTLTDHIHENISAEALFFATQIRIDWSEKEKNELHQRKILALGMSVFLVLQWLTAVLLVVLQGFYIINIDDTSFISFFVSIIVQTIGIIVAMVKYLFKERSTKPLDVISNLIEMVGRNNRFYDNEARQEHQ